MSEMINELIDTSIAYLSAIDSEFEGSHNYLMPGNPYRTELNNKITVISIRSQETLLEKYKPVISTAIIHKDKTELNRNLFNLIDDIMK